MDFIISLAHFCEVHGPTSILCTQVIPPICIICYPPSHSTTVRSPSAQLAFNAPTPPGSSHGYNQTPNNTTPVQLASKNNNHFARASSDSTPPSSPRSPVLSSTSLPNASASGGASATGASSKEDACRNCSISFPKAVNDSLMGVTAEGRAASSHNGWGKKAPLRSTETVLVGVPRNASEAGDSSQNLSSSPRFNSPFDSAARLDQNAIPQGSSSPRSSLGFTTHTHAITYISSRSPTVPSRYATVRQACIRTLSCELVPAQTGPMLFGDPLAGYTIAFVFRIADAKARGGRRTYALLCMSPNQKALIHCWSSVTFVFQSLVHEIQHAAADKAAKDAQSSPSFGNSISSVTSRGPEGFLRRRAPGDGGSQKCLAELVGREDFFVELHAKFVCLLSKITKVYGHSPPGNHELAPAPAIPLSMNFSLDSRSRTGSVSSTTGSDEQRDRRNTASASPVIAPQQPRQDLQQQSASTGVPPPINKTTQLPATSTSGNSTRREEELAQINNGIKTRRRVAVGY
ncbi:vesicle coat protein [Geopyxis carbonaria]|nr:vesicle coat protein [Geopyxis carbonaria]